MAYKTPREVQERKDEKHRHILDTAVKVFASRGYHGTSVRDIVNEAGVSVGSFYFYFKSKEDLFEILYDEMFTFLFNAASCALNFELYGTAKCFVHATIGFLKAFQERRELARIMMVEAIGLNPRFEAKRAQVTKTFCQSVEEDILELQERKQVSVPDCGIAAIAYIGTIYNAVDYWLQNEETVNITQYVFPLVLYNLRAMAVEFNEKEIEKYIEELLKNDLKDGGIAAC